MYECMITDYLYNSKRDEYVEIWEINLEQLYDFVRSNNYW